MSNNTTATAGVNIEQMLEQKIASYLDAKRVRAEAASDLQKAQALSEATATVKRELEIRMAELNSISAEKAAARAERAAERDFQASQAKEAREMQMKILATGIEALGKLGTNLVPAVEAAAKAADPTGLMAAWEDVKSFAKAHPWLTAGLVLLGVVAVALVAYTAYDYLFGADTSGTLDGDSALRLASGQ